MVMTVPHDRGPAASPPVGYRLEVERKGVALLSADYPRRAASMRATSIFVIDIMAEKARLPSAPPTARASVSTRGVICQDKPQRSLHQPHALSWPPLSTIAFQ